MQFINKSYKTLIAVVLSVFTVSLFFQSCEVEEKFELKAFGPSEVTRGGEIYFVGKKLDEVSKITLPDGRSFGSAEFTSSTPEKITLHIPEDYPLHVAGKIRIEKTNGEIVETTSSFKVFSNISLLSVDPDGKNAPLKPGDQITIKGLNLKAVDAIVFKNGTVCAEFEEHTDNVISLVLPHAISAGAISARVPAGYDEAGVPIHNYVEGPKIVVVEPILAQINGEARIELKPGAEVTLTGEYFGGIDIVNGQVTVSFTGSASTASAAIDVQGNSLTFTLPIALEPVKEFTVIVNANGGNPITSVAIFTIEKTEIIGHTPTSVWESKGEVVLTGKNFQAVSRMTLSRKVQQEDENGEMVEVEVEKAIALTAGAKSPDGTTITFKLPSSYGRDGKEIPKLYLYSGGNLYYDYYPAQ
jgi:hypothetical protein